MKNATLLTVLGPDCSEPSYATAVDTARDKNLHLAFLVVDALSPIPAYAMGVPPYGAITIPETWRDDLEAVGTALNAKMDEIEQLLKAQGVSGDVKVVSGEPPLLRDATARRAAVCDVATISADLREEDTIFRSALHGLLFESPTPVLLNGGADLAPDRVLVSWNTNLPTGRAVHHALPLLKAAEEVTIATFDPVMTETQDGENPGSDLAKWLSHHGCTVTVQQYPSGGQEIGECILERAAEVGADLVVAGAYGHSRMRQSIFGGTTQTLITQTGTPVLLAH